MNGGLRPGVAAHHHGVFALVLICLAGYLLDHPFGLDLEALYLDHGHARPWQFVTALFLHADWMHLSGNLFFLLIFGRLIEERTGAATLVGAYLLCGIGANLASAWLHGAGSASLGASGAVFGLFFVSVLIRLAWDWRALLETLILGQFVIGKTLAEITGLGSGDEINRIAHLGGAACGVLLTLLLMHLPHRHGNRRRR